MPWGGHEVQEKQMNNNTARIHGLEQELTLAQKELAHHQSESEEHIASLRVENHTGTLKACSMHISGVARAR